MIEKWFFEKKTKTLANQNVPNNHSLFCNFAAGVKRKVDEIDSKTSVTPKAPGSVGGAGPGPASVKRPHTDGDSSTPKPASAASAKKLTDPLKFCNDLLKELFNKKHSSYAWPFYKVG